MKTTLGILAALAVIGLAFWAYRENYLTKASLKRVGALNGQIAEARRTLRALNAEWAHQNRPDRLRDLVEINFGDLGLMRMTPRQFGDVGRLPDPPEDPAGADGAAAAAEEKES